MTANKKNEKDSQQQVTGIVTAIKPKATTMGGTFDYDKIISEVDILKGDIINLKKEAKHLKDEQKKNLNFMMVVVIGVVIALIITVIPLTVDYFRYNYSRYESFIKNVDNLKTRIDILEKNNYLNRKNK